eukprot:TRINITY_DN6547_c0_g2_i2.p1 TRINITY_DN6547_c0_g2~~TRINITY_DN6547_c0_g2_i2.p1  ORF type:complete len:731 (-),score=62.90 TRINITY_DN6547_c0_g2_i2:11-2203(-)
MTEPSLFAWIERKNLKRLEPFSIHFIADYLPTDLVTEKDLYLTLRSEDWSDRNAPIVKNHNILSFKKHTTILKNNHNLPSCFVSISCLQNRSWIFAQHARPPTAKCIKVFVQVYVIIEQCTHTATLPFASQQRDAIRLTPMPVLASTPLLEALEFSPSETGWSNHSEFDYAISEQPDLFPESRKRILQISNGSASDSVALPKRNRQGPIGRSIDKLIRMNEQGMIETCVWDMGRMTYVKPWEACVDPSTNKYVNVCQGFVDPYHLWDHDMLYIDVYIALQEAELVPEITLDMWKNWKDFERLDNWLFNVIKFINPELFFYVLRSAAFVNTKRKYQWKKFKDSIHWEDVHMPLNFTDEQSSKFSKPGYIENLRCKDNGLSFAIEDALKDERGMTLMQHLPSPHTLIDALHKSKRYDGFKPRNLVGLVRDGLPINFLVDGGTYLSSCILSLSLQEITEAIDKGADVNLGSPPPLYTAALKGDCPKMDLLIQLGAELNHIGEDGLPILTKLLSQYLDPSVKVDLFFIAPSVDGVRRLLQQEQIDVELVWYTLLQHLGSPQHFLLNSHQAMEWILKMMPHLDNVFRIREFGFAFDFDKFLDSILCGADPSTAWVEHVLDEMHTLSNNSTLSELLSALKKTFFLKDQMGDVMLGQIQALEKSQNDLIHIKILNLKLGSLREQVEAHMLLFSQIKWTSNVGSFRYRSSRPWFSMYKTHLEGLCLLIEELSPIESIA